MDFRISDWISGFQSGFLDFIWISGFQNGFLLTVYEISFVVDPSLTVTLITVNKWPSPPPLPQRSPSIRRRHNVHNYTSLAPTNGSCDVHSSVGAPPPDTPILATADYDSKDYTKLTAVHKGLPKTP